VSVADLAIERRKEICRRRESEGIARESERKEKKNGNLRKKRIYQMTENRGTASV
jgi:hypothetical protein